MLRTSCLSLALLTATGMVAQYTATVKTSVTKLESSPWSKWSDAVCSINYPAGWTSEGAAANDRMAAFQAPADSSGRWTERVELFRRAAGGAGIEAHGEQAAADVQGSFNAVKLLGSSLADDTHTIEFTAERNGRPLHVKQERRVLGDHLWVLSYMADPGFFDESLFMADAMFASFSVK